jgi:hypothetical protein
MLANGMLAAKPLRGEYIGSLERDSGLGKQM